MLDYSKFLDSLSLDQQKVIDHILSEFKECSHRSINLLYRIQERYPEVIEPDYIGILPEDIKPEVLEYNASCYEVEIILGMLELYYPELAKEFKKPTKINYK